MLENRNIFKFFPFLENYSNFYNVMTTSWENGIIAISKKVIHYLLLNVNKWENKDSIGFDRNIL